MWVLSFGRNLSNKYKKQLLNTGLDSLRTASKNVVHKAGELFGNQTPEAVTKSNDNWIVKRKPAKEIAIPTEKREEVLN